MPVEARKFSGDSMPFWCESMIRTMGEYNQITYQHSVRVGLGAARFWQHLQAQAPLYRSGFVTPHDMFLAGLLHDNKKTDVPVSTLNNQRRDLTSEEMELLAQHPFTGAEAVAPYNPKLADIIRGHHRFGKNGVIYPSYEDDPAAQEAMKGPGYRQIEKAQLVMALIDKTDTGLNRIDGLLGKAIDEERTELLKRFHKEIEAGLMDETWIDTALQVVSEIGSEDLAQWAFT